MLPEWKEVKAAGLPQVLSGSVSIMLVAVLEALISGKIAKCSSPPPS
jgi:hypothetical protein